MSSTNPYNCTTPANLFVGYERVRRHFLNGFRNGNSFAIIGGRRCGKTSLMIQIEKDLRSEPLAPFTPLPRYLDIQGLSRLTPALLFETMYSLVVQDVEAKGWASGESGREYQNFLEHLDAAQPLMDQHYGADWLVILLVDELDTAIASLPSDQFFQNLRNLLMVSRFQRHFRLVASGVNDLATLISSGSSPLNNLRNRHLGILTGAQARQLIAFGFPEGLDPEVEWLVFQLTGRHPYLLQGLLEKLWEDQTGLDKKAVRRMAADFLREHRTFARWLEVFGPAEHAVYQCLSAAPEGTLHVRDMRHRIDPTLTPKTDDALTVLSYHGIIDDSDPDEPQIAGTLFRDWYRDNGPIQPNSSKRQAAPVSLFYSYSHKDESSRNELETHLKLLQRQGLIAPWHDRKIEAGDEWKRTIDENLERADVILLLVSADFIASDYCYEQEMRRALERHENGEARVIPIILDDVNWGRAPFAKLQALPKDGRPVTKWRPKTSAWRNISEGIERVAEEALSPDRRAT
jgi:hypothetical protein